MPKTRKAARRDFSATPILTTKFRDGDQPLAVSSLSTWYSVWRRNPDVSRAVEILAQTAAKSGFAVLKGDRPFQSPETDALVSSYLAAKDEFVTNAKVGGNGFLEILRNFAGDPVGVRPLDPRKVTIYTDSQTGAPVRYVYADPMKQGRQYSFQAEDVVHWIPVKDADRPAWGVSAIERIVYDALGDDRAAMYNYVRFENNGIPEHLIKLKDEVTAETAEKLKEQMESKFGGAKNAGKTGVMSTAIDAVLPLKAEDDGKYLEMRKMSTEKVCAALGVPRSLLNYTDGVNYATADSQYRVFIENTVRPVETSLEDILNGLLSPYGARAEVIDEHISQAKEWATIAAQLLAAGIITQDEARAYVGFEPIQEVA